MRRSLLIFACISALAADRQPDEAAIMTRILTRVRASVAKIPNYTCLETITREYYEAMAPVARSCDVVLAAQEHPTLNMQLRHTATDRLRIEVAMSSHGEMHSWPGDKSFYDGKIDAMVREGPMGTGTFGAFLAAVFQQDVKNYRFLEQLTVEGRLRARFAFAVPRTDSHYFIKLDKDWKETAYDGTFEADVETGELAWVALNTAVLPEIAGTCQTRTRIELGQAAIGDSDFLLTRRARQEFIGTDSSHTVNTMEFSSCREYRGESTISFGTAPEASGSPVDGTKRQAAPPAAKPTGIRFNLELTSPLDSATAAAGDRFTARVRNTPLTLHSIAPNNAIVEGRILRVQTYYGKSPEVIFVLRPQTVEIHGVKTPLTAIQDTRYAIEQQRSMLKQKRAPIILPYRSETNAGLFRFLGEHAVVKSGYMTHWVTVRPM